MDRCVFQRHTFEGESKFVETEELFLFHVAGGFFLRERLCSPVKRYVRTLGLMQPYM